MNWKQILASVDDDYLIGISNKGIVKRAYKDKEESGETLEADLETESAELIVTLGGENVKICNPLGDSKCSCPSRSICRHVILGILLAKEQIGESSDEPAEAAVEQGEEKDTCQAAQVLEEIKAYPLKPLLRALGPKALYGLLERMQTQDLPRIKYASVITVELPEQEVVVKLLSPLEHSSCTCHKKELCRHKAEAMIWCQWMEQVITTAKLTEILEQTPEFDREQIKEASLQIKSYLEELLRMGLSRTSMEVVNTLERLAIIAHNADLPKLENYLRALADTYAKYLRRSASFSVSEGMKRVCRLYRQMVKLQTAEHNSDISSLAGAFHAQYKPAGDLDLVGITWEHFVSQSGYEGDTIYFLEEHTGKWYTYTNARPTFYDGRKRNGYTEKAQAPWGLPVSLEGLVHLKIHLQGAKCDDNGRLSSSQETRGEITGNRDLSEALLKGWHYDDFGEAFVTQITMDGESGKGKEGLQRPQLVFLQPAETAPAEFMEVEQVLRMPLWDAEGRNVLVEVPYSQKEDQTIRYLERLKENPPPCFVGRLYLKESRLLLYPLDMYGIKEMPWSHEQQKRGLHVFGNKKPIEQREFAENTPRDAILEVLEEVEAVLGDLYQVGFDTVQDGVWRSLTEVGEKAECYGMQHLSKLLLELAEQIAMERHRIGKMGAAIEDSMFRQYTELCEYVFIGKKKAMYDRAKEYYTKREE